MNTLKKLTITMLSAMFILSLNACTPEIGSNKWCAMMKEKPKGDWTASEAADFTKHCLISFDVK